MIRVLDTETSGLDPADDAVCEVATVDVVEVDGQWKRGETWSSLVNPGRFIGVEAMAVHHITDAMVQGQPMLRDVASFLDPGEGNVVAAFNARFDMGFLANYVPAERPVICAYKVAVTLWPEAPKHSNQTLRYWLGLKLDEQLASPPHRALPDAYVTAAILVRALGKMPVSEIIDISSRPVLLPRVSFGMHFGVAWSEVPTKYMEWCLLQKMDEDVHHTCRTWLERKRRRA